jgi:hypothetical protein
MSFEVLMALSMLVFWVVMPYGLVDTNQHFGRREDGGSTFSKMLV